MYVEFQNRTVRSRTLRKKESASVEFITNSMISEFFLVFKWQFVCLSAMKLQLIG